MSENPYNDWQDVPKEYQQASPPPSTEARTPETVSNELENAINDIREEIESAAAEVSSWWETKGEQDISAFLDQAGDKIKEAAEIVKTEVDETVEDMKARPSESRKSVFGKIAGEVQILFKRTVKPK